MNVVKYEVNTKTYDAVVEFSDGVKAEFNMEGGRWITFTSAKGQVVVTSSRDDGGQFQLNLQKLNAYDEQGPVSGDAAMTWLLTRR